MRWCSPGPLFDSGRQSEADRLIEQEVARERCVIKRRLAAAGVPFHPEMATEDLIDLARLLNVIIAKEPAHE
jgi:hypothetical protein